MEKKNIERQMPPKEDLNVLIRRALQKQEERRTSSKMTRRTRIVSEDEGEEVGVRDRFEELWR